MDKQDHHLYQFGPFRLDTSEGILLRHEERVFLTPIDIKLLILLINRRGHILEKEELMREVWPEVFVEEGNLNRHISTLRKALGETHHEREYIETISRRGYRFIAPVRELRDESTELIDEGHTAVPSHFNPIPPARNMPMDSLAVLPLVNVNADPNVEYLAEGITDSVINILSRLPQLRVMARSTVSRYKGREISPQEVARELGVRALMVGSLLQFGDNLIVKAELVDAWDGSQLWGEQYSRTASDIFALQEEISRKISKNLRLRLTSEQTQYLNKQNIANTEAYQAYLMGRFLLNKRTPEGLTKSVKYFEQAIILDPHYAPAYVGLTESYIYLRDYNLVSLADSIPKAKEMVLRALQLDTNLAEAHMALAHVLKYEWDWRGMEEEYQRAIKINPNIALVHKSYSVLLRHTGRFEESFAEIQKAQEIDPISPNIIATAAANFYCARQYDRALTESLKVIELEPSMPSGHFVAGRVYAQQGKYQEAIKAFQKAGSLFEYDNPEITASLACAYGLSGNTRKARQLLAQLLERSRREDIRTYDIAVILTVLGDTDQAFAYLEQSFEEQGVELYYLKVDPLLDRLRDDTRFENLQRRVGFTIDSVAGIASPI